MLKRNIWDLPDYHCPIIGTCLTTAELHKLSARINLVFPEGATDYELHGCFVGLAKRPERPARVIQKYLDKKFDRQLRRFLKTSGDDALWALWTTMADSGDIPGAFWSLMRHPLASNTLLSQVYGEVHMLSHMVGASTRADLRRLTEAQQQVERLTEALTERKRVLREAVAVWKRRTIDLERQLSAERARREQAERERISLRELLENRAVVELERDREALLTQLEGITTRAVEAEATCRRQAGLIEATYREESTLRADLAERDREVEALELALLSTMAAAPGRIGGCTKNCAGPSCAAECDSPENCPCPKLRGKCVLYVGGRSGLRGQYRQLGEKFGCELLHHDAGLEQSSQHLQQLLHRADAVVCPVDCISHEACAAVKRLCKNASKPVCFARSSGLSSLASSLAALDRACQ